MKPTKPTKLLRIGILVIFTMLGTVLKAQNTYMELEQLTVNENVTTIITASEPVKVVDISTENVAGDQPIDNTVRLKPKDGNHSDGDVLAIVTIVTERYRSQYALVYTTRSQEAVTDKEILVDERIAYNNPSVTMSLTDMAKYARRIWNSPARYRNIKTNKNKMQMRLNNVYSVGEYFFIDFSVINKTKIRFDIEQLRISLKDKKQSRKTTVQTIELLPAFVLDKSKFFQNGYRNVFVIQKMTFPNDKVLSIELSEEQISGRTISMDIDYEDVLAADSFNSMIVNED